MIVALALSLFSVRGRQSIVLNGESDDMSEMVSLNFDNEEAREASAAAETELNQPSMGELAELELPELEWAPDLESITDDPSWMEQLTGRDAGFEDAVLASADSPMMGTHEIGFFGIEATGNRVIYILDMSVSMGYESYFGPRYVRAVNELLKSVDQLKTDQQFYVFLFCFQCYGMEIGQPPGQFCGATDENRERLANWLGGVQLGGGTDPREAIVKALELKPSCVFLLSDGEFNGRYFRNPPYGRAATEIELAKQHNVDGCPIHTIGLEDRANQFDLTKISEQSGGVYKFVSGERH